MYIFLIVLFSVLGAYLLLVLVDVIFIISFSSIMKGHDHSIKLLIGSKIEALKKLVDELKRSNTQINDDLLMKFKEVTDVRLNDLNASNYSNIKNTLSYLEGELYSLAYPFEDNEIISQLSEEISQINTAYRSMVIMYNADVLGYNYWIRFLPCRFLFFKLKTKSLIS